MNKSDPCRADHVKSVTYTYIDILTDAIKCSSNVSPQIELFVLSLMVAVEIMQNIEMTL